MSFTLPSLPYQRNALVPYVSEETINFHYGKHHQTYLDNLNKLSAGTKYEKLPLQQVITESYNDKNTAIFNNAAQVYNHTFFWNSMTPNGGGTANGEIHEQITRDFGSLEKFKEEFKNAALTQFGSGWAWLAYDIDAAKLKVVKTPNAENTLTMHGEKGGKIVPILTIDVWEHSYYLDFQNRRGDYVDTFFNNLVNWTFANENLHSAK
jgi:Fe-Mn family superoxide dismutase